jgi:regulation of enolase protein 1 (concanavalin A-like superfamily)
MVIAAAQAPTLTAPAGPVLRVASEAALQAAITRLTPSTTVILQPGRYRLSQALLIANADHVTIRGATDNPADVVITGATGAGGTDAGAPSGFEVAAPNVTIANLTLTGFSDTAITVSDGGVAPRVSNVVISDSAHLVRVETSAAGAPGQGIIEGSRFLSSSPSRVLDGITIGGGKGWVVRGNRFQGIRPVEPNAAALHVEGNATSVVVEGNLFANCLREIAIGTPGGSGASAIVRNNFIVRARADAAGDLSAPIQVAGDLPTVVAQNTILTRGADAAVSTSGSDTPATIANNLSDAPIDLTGSQKATTSHNDTTATPSLFVNASAGDLHLSASGHTQLRRVPRLSQAATDVDGEARAASVEPGADTVVAASSAPAAAAPSTSADTATATTLAAPTTDVTTEAVTANAVPSPWLTRDIGSPSLAGDATYSSGTFTLKGTGADIGAKSDQFRFVYQPLAGDGQIVARVTSMTNTNAWAKAGVMIREGLAANARHFGVFLTPTSGVVGRWRTTVGGSTTAVTGSGAAPVWLKIVRAGSKLTSYKSSNGSTWTTAWSTSISMTGTIYVGLAATSHVTSKTTTATFTNVSVTAGTTNQPPTVSVSAGGTSFTAPATFVLTATAADSDGSIARVDLYQGSTRLKSDTTSPYSVGVSSLAAGSYSFKAVAFDNKGASTTSSTITVTVTSSSGSYPTKVTFTPSVDDSIVTNYVFEVFASTANPNTAAPLATQNLGKPVPSGGIDTVTVGTTISKLAPGNYIATVSAVGTGGSSRSAAASFTR